MVIGYSYLWRAQYLRGQEEGVKDRPCTVILVTTTQDEIDIVTVLPITHSHPDDPDLAVELPPATKKRLGLDAEWSWVILSEANAFVWPGPDLRPRDRSDPASVAYGLLPYKLMDDIRLRFVAILKAQRAATIKRTK